MTKKKNCRPTDSGRRTNDAHCYRISGDPKRYISVILGAIDRGRLTYNGDANCEQTFRSLSSVIDVISPKNGKALSIETLVSYEKKERAGEFSDYSEGDFK